MVTWPEADLAFCGFSRQSSIGLTSGENLLYIILPSHIILKWLWLTAWVPAVYIYRWVCKTWACMYRTIPYRRLTPLSWAWRANWQTLRKFELARSITVWLGRYSPIPGTAPPLPPPPPPPPPWFHRGTAGPTGGSKRYVLSRLGDKNKHSCSKVL